MSCVFNLFFVFLVDNPQAFAALIYFSHKDRFYMLRQLTMKHYTDFELMKLGIENHSEAFGELFERHKQRVYNVCNRICRNHDDAEDAVQETFLSVIAKAHTFKFDGKFTTWVHTIASNVCLMRIRAAKSKKETLYNDNFCDLESESRFPVRSENRDVNYLTIRHELRDVLDDAIGSLPPKQKFAYMAREIDRQPVPEVSEKMAMSEAACKYYLHSARVSVREAVEMYLKAA